MKSFSRLLVAAAMVAAFAGSADAAYPERPITLIVPWAAGGGTDAIGRMIAQGLQEDLGQPVNVVNRTGAGGIVGHKEMADADPDGYTIGLATIELVTYRAMGTSDLSSADVTPIALMNFDAAAFSVQADSEWATLADALAAIKAAPAGTYKASGFPVGAGYHLALSGLLTDNGIDPRSIAVVPSQGAAPGFQELVSGGVDIVPSSLPEAAPMLQSGLIRTLAVLAPERLSAYPDVPTAIEAVGTDSVGGSWRGVVGPAGLPPEIVARLEAALHEVAESEAYVAFMDGRGFGRNWLPAAEFGPFMERAEESAATSIEKLGLRQ